MSDSLASRVRHLMRCGALPNKAKMEVEGRVTEVSMFDVEKALERAENPKLPEGYSVEGKQLISPEGYRVAWTDESAELRVNYAVSARHFPALAAFLQGAR